MRGAPSRPSRSRCRSGRKWHRRRKRCGKPIFLRQEASQASRSFYHNALTTDDRPLLDSVHRVVLGDDPFTIFEFGSDGEEFIVGAILAGQVAAGGPGNSGGGGGGVFPVDQVPHNQRGAPLRIAYGNDRLFFVI